ncbi:MAG: agmatine deiminase family protein [Ignavibacteria bacterium]|nr:agmatine deiminase family protein [Ignavibacteria bacterium]
MKTKIIFLLYLFLFAANLLSQDLPHYLTNEEKEKLKTYIPPIGLTEYTNPPSRQVRTMAEWEELEGIIITWTSYTSILRQIVDYAQEEGKVYIVCSDSNSVKTYLTSGGVPLTNVKYIIASFNSIWVRDYGPWTVYADDVDSLYLIDWTYNRPRPADDLIPVTFANYYNVPIYQTTTSPNNLTNTGGNFMTDGMGTGFASKLILTDNPTKSEADIDSIMKKYMGITRYIKMNTLPYDEIHHIDMHMKLLDEETLLVGQYPTGISDGPQIEANLTYVLTNFQSSFGRPYKVIRIPMPPDATGRYPSGGGQYRTFTNSVFVNKSIIIPTYDLQYDTTALRIYREALPGYNVVGINSNGIISALGTIHCITKEVGVKEPIYITHKQQSTSPQTDNGIEIRSVIKTISGIASAAIYWKRFEDTRFVSSPMQLLTDNEYAGMIPPQMTGTKLVYYISVTSNSGKQITRPITAPNGYFTTIADVAVPVELINLRIFTHGNSLTINWQTITETNNYGFEIERKNLNHNLSSNEWEMLGFIEGKGTSAISSSYEFKDVVQTGGNYQYRLKQIDYNGQFTFYSLSEVDIIPFEFDLYQNYPNPFNPTTTISFQIPNEEFVSLKIYDILGNEIQTLLNKIVKPGIHNIQFEASSLASGIYFYILKTKENFNSKKMILTK